MCIYPTTQVVCHSAEVAKDLSQRLNRSCLGTMRSKAPWEPNVNYELWSEEGSCDCSRELNFSMHELQVSEEGSELEGGRFKSHSRLNLVGSGLAARCHIQLLCS